MSIECDIAAIRKRAWHYLEPSVAGCAGMTLDQLKQFVAGTYHPEPDVFRRLANRMAMPGACVDEVVQ
jgi:hypothetical protein